MSGVASHAATPARGLSAICAAAKLIQELEDASMCGRQHAWRDVRLGEPDRRRQHSERDGRGYFRTTVKLLLIGWFWPALGLFETR